MRYALLATSSLVLLALTSYACSSSDDPKTTTTPDAGKSSSGTSGNGTGTGDDDDNTSGGTSSGGTSSGDGTSSGGTSSGGTSSGGTSSGDGGTSGTTSSSGTVDAGPKVDGGATAGTLCVEANEQEKDNAADDSQATAQTLKPIVAPGMSSFCGRIESATDVDYYTVSYSGVDFSTQKFSGSFDVTGNPSPITIKIITGGKEYGFADNGIVYSSPVVFKVTGTAQGDYRVSWGIVKK